MRQANVTPLIQGRRAPADPAVRVTGLVCVGGGRRKDRLSAAQLLRAAPAAKVAKLRLLSTLRMPAAKTGARSVGATLPASLPAKHAAALKPRERIFDGFVSRF